MKLKCENIGKLSSAEVELKTITVIAGFNSTGKSTIGKLFYSIFNSFFDIKNESKKQLLQIIERYVEPEGLSFEYDSESIEKCAKLLFEKRNCSDKDEISNIISSIMGNEFLEKRKEDYLDDIISVLNIPDSEIYELMLQRNLSREFDRQIGNFIFKDKESKIYLKIKDEEIRATIKDNYVEEINNIINLKTKAIYIDDPFVLDSLNNRNTVYSGHKGDLCRNLRRTISAHSDIEATIKEILINQKIERIYSKLDSVCKGNIVQDSKNGFIFQLEKSDDSLRLVNISTGLKALAIIKTLLLNGSIEKNGTMILDEPEIHLHPQWQKILAEIIVLIQKDFNMHILINSHSPYFINAIDVYAKKYGIRDTTKFYLSDDNELDFSRPSTLKDVSDDLQPIYKLLFNPLQELEDELYEIEDKKEND